jgi:hypothetical protein
MEGVEPRPSRQSTGYSLHSPRDLSGRDQGQGSWHLRIEYRVDTATVLSTDRFPVIPSGRQRLHCEPRKALFNQ